MLSLARQVSLAIALAVTPAVTPAVALYAQLPDSASRPAAVGARAAFIGQVRNANDDSGVRSADIRLFYIDSIRVTQPNTPDSLEAFVDTTRSRLGVSDSGGNFAIRSLVPGRYIFEVRRVGLSPVRGFVVVDSTTVSTSIVMDVASQVLAKVQVTATSVDKVNARLNRVGYLDRHRFEGTGTFVDRQEILRRKPQTVADILAWYGFHDDKGVEFQLDRFAVDYNTVQSYPAELVIGVEVYRHNRPAEYNMTRGGPNMFSSGGAQNASQVLVLIWTSM